MQKRLIILRLNGIFLCLTATLFSCSGTGPPDSGPRSVAAPASLASFLLTMPGVVNQFITNGDKSALLAEQAGRPAFAPGTNADPTITFDPGASFQTMDGFGFALTEGSAEVISGLSGSGQAELLNDLFHPTLGIGVSVVRISIGASVLELLELYLSGVPYTSGGCTQCQGALTVSGGAYTRNVSYYIVAHLAKFVRPGALRVGTSSTSSNLVSAGFVNDRTAGGARSLVVLNKGATMQSFNISYGSKIVSVRLNAGSVATYVWY